MFDVNAETGEIFLYDDIGPAWLGMIDAGLVIDGLSHIPTSKRVLVRLNTRGGDVDEAIAIYGALERRGGIDIAIDSRAFSAGSYIAMVGETITIAEGGAFMIHDPWTIALGNASELRKTADVLDTYRDRFIGAYEKRLKLGREEVEAILAAETWYRAQQALDAGLADVIGNKAVEDPTVEDGRYKNAPRSLVRPAKAGTRTEYPINRKKGEMRLMRHRCKNG